MSHTKGNFILSQIRNLFIYTFTRHETFNAEWQIFFYPLFFFDFISSGFSFTLFLFHHFCMCKSWFNQFALRCGVCFCAYKHFFAKFPQFYSRLRMHSFAYDSFKIRTLTDSLIVVGKSMENMRTDNDLNMRVKELLSAISWFEKLNILCVCVCFCMKNVQKSTRVHHTHIRGQQSF